MKPKRSQFDEQNDTPWPSPIGMGALVSPDDFIDARNRELAKQREEQAFDSGGMKAVEELRRKGG